MKKLWLVKREVWAENVEKAIHVRRGRVYAVDEADDKFQPEDPSKKKIGYKKK